MRNLLVLLLALLLTGCLAYEERVEIEVMLPPVVDLSKYKDFYFLSLEKSFKNLSNEHVDFEYEISNFVLNELRTKTKFNVEPLEREDFSEEKLSDPAYWKSLGKPAFALIYSGEVTRYYAYYRREISAEDITAYPREGLVETLKLKLRLCFYVFEPSEGKKLYEKCISEKMTFPTTDPVTFSLYTVLQRSLSSILRDISYQRVRQTHYLLRGK